MKTSITSNLRPLSHSLYVFLIAVAAVWAIPRNAHAQLYVTHEPGGAGVVGAYDAKTGAAINASFITGLNNPVGLVVKGSTNTLFVANLASGQQGTATVGKYDATTGVAINARFIRGLNAATGLAVLGNTLFVASFNNSNIYPGMVSTYDANTGAEIQPGFIITLLAPFALAVKVTPLEPLHKSILFVADAGQGIVEGFGAVIPTAIFAVTGLNDPEGLAVFGNTLFVANYGSGTVGAYDAKTGVAINASFITRLNQPDGLAVLGNTLFVLNFASGQKGTGTVGKYDATTGAAINASFITGLTGPRGIAVKKLHHEGDD
jgi:hypothetical protein